MNYLRLGLYDTNEGSPDYTVIVAVEGFVAGNVDVSSLPTVATTF